MTGTTSLFGKDSNEGEAGNSVKYTQQKEKQQVANNSQKNGNVIFVSSLGKRTYEQSDAAQVWAKLQEKWQRYKENPTQENKDNLVTPILVRR